MAAPVHRYSREYALLSQIPLFYQGFLEMELFTSFHSILAGSVERNDPLAHYGYQPNSQLHAV